MNVADAIRLFESRRARVVVAERWGRRAGYVMAPVVALLSRARNARMFHPDGVVYGVTVERANETPELRELGQRLEGAGIARFSSALWRGGSRWPDVLGMAVRLLGSGRVDEAVLGDPGDQDLLLATIRFPWTMPFAPLTTHVGSFLWNHYHGVSPFEIAGVGRAKLRVRSPRLESSRDLGREEHLARAAERGAAAFEIQVRLLDDPPWSRQWRTVARLRLEAPVEIDQSTLRFSPFRDGKGIRPIGFVHHLRVGTYDASQWARGGRLHLAAAR